MSNGFGFRPEDSGDPDESEGVNDATEPSASNEPPVGSPSGNPNFDINKIFEEMRAMGLPTPELPEHVKDQLNALTAMAQGMINSSQNPSGSSEPFTLPLQMIRDISRRTLAESGEVPVGHKDSDAMKGALQLAELWLDDATALPNSHPSDGSGSDHSTSQHSQGAASRSDWINYSLEGWQSFTTPLVDGISEAMQRMISSTSEENPNFPQVNISQLMAGFMGTMIRTQLGRSIGKFATTVTSAHDAAIPLSTSSQSFLIPENVRAWGEGLGIDEREVEIYLALREAAAAKLFAATPWLRDHLHTLVSKYGKGIHIDIQSMQRQAEDALSRGDLDPSDPTSMQNAIANGIFTPEESETQRIALGELELLLALIEGWIDLVVTTSAGERLSSLSRLQETQRRRRATQSPTQELFASLIGLEVSPRTIRECANFWRAMTNSLTIKERDQLWEDPYALPRSGEVSDPENFLNSRRVPDDLSGLDGK